MTIKNQIEVKTLEHNGIKVNYLVDYVAKKASVVELVDCGNSTKSQKKNWVFAERGLQYMDGWLNILEAMRLAVIQCKKALEEREKEDDKKEEEFMVKIQEEQFKLNKKAK